MGYARLGDAAGARSEIARLLALRDELKKRDDAYWAEQVEIQGLAATAWVALLEGKGAEAVNMMRAAADLEDGSEKHVAMPAGSSLTKGADSNRLEIQQAKAFLASR